MSRKSNAKKLDFEFMATDSRIVDVYSTKKHARKQPQSNKVSNDCLSFNIPFHVAI
jgi:hypothetical protein